MSTSRVDLAILGAGAGGMMSALVGARHGLSIALIDPHFSAPNNLYISGGLFPAAGSRLQAGAGVADGPQAWLDDLRAFAGASVNERIAGAIAHALPRLTDFLVEQCAAPIRFLADVPAPGHGRTRFHSVEPASGRALHTWLRNATAGERAVDCIADAPLAAVSRNAAGFAIEHADAAGRSRRVQARCLMLAGGGFGGNPRMVARYIPEMAHAQNLGAANNDGSAIALAQNFGATLAGMDGYQGQGHTNPDGKTRLGMSLPLLGAVMVNRDGRRFVREDIGPSALAAHVLAQPGQVALEVFDAHIENQLGNHSAYVDARAAGRIIACDALADLAALAGVPAAPLAHTLKECARFAAGAADPLGRHGFAHVLRPPYRASWVTGTLAHTQGGIVTDDGARVLDATGTPIPGLLAAGGSAAGLSGHGGDAYLPGNGLAQSFGLAWLAVQSIVAGAQHRYDAHA